jgi:hypothetical protein
MSSASPPRTRICVPLPSLWKSAGSNSSDANNHRAKRTKNDGRKKPVMKKRLKMPEISRMLIA